MAKVYTFNRPIVGLILIPLLFLSVLLLFGLFQEFNLMVIVLSLVSLLFLLPIVYLAFFRRLRVGEQVATWITPKLKHELNYSEIRSFGVVRYRSFRFMYISRLEEAPFAQPTEPVMSSEDTFVVQFRRKGWNHLKGLVLRQHPDLRPVNYTRK